ncbi:unnamed protein product [Ixodes hexagonus]
MTQQQWNDYYNAIAAQDHASTAAQGRTVRYGQPPTAQQSALREDTAQQAYAQQSAMWEEPQPATLPAAQARRYRKERSLSSESESPESSGTEAALRYIGFAFIAVLCVVLILVILAGAEGWPFKAPHTSSVQRKGAELSHDKEDNAFLVGKRSHSGELVVPKRSAKLVKSAGDILSRDTEAASQRRGKVSGCAGGRTE